MSDQFDLADFASIPDPLAKPARSAPPGPVPAAAPAPVAPSEVGPTRSTLHKRRLIAILVAFSWLFAVQIFIGIRDDVPAWIMVLHVGVPTLLGSVALWLAVQPGRVGLGPSMKAVAGFVVAAAVVFGVASLCTPCLERGLPLVQNSFLCGDWIMGIAIVPLAALAWAQRRSFAAGWGFRSGLLGISVGFTAAGMQALHCAHSDGMHVLLGHGWPVIGMGLLGYFLLRDRLRVA
ncbi:MAG: DUF1109 family protein [Polyangiaceae bacterium]|nr:DUF1109 family protein [Polyangiaceae bacterium]